MLWEGQRQYEIEREYQNTTAPLSWQGERGGREGRKGGEERGNTIERGSGEGDRKRGEERFSCILAGDRMCLKRGRLRVETDN